MVQSIVTGKVALASAMVQLVLGQVYDIKQI